MTKKGLQELVTKNLRNNPKSKKAWLIVVCCQKIVATAGREHWALVAAGLQRWYDLADGRIRTEKEDYEAGRM